VLSGVLHSFLASGRAGVPFQPVPVPALGLSESDKQCIRDRSCIMARHILADQPEEYIQAQVNLWFRSCFLCDPGNYLRQFFIWSKYLLSFVQPFN
jgi:peroxin-5